MDFIPINKEELQNRQPDFVLVTGDAYVDHPSFGAAVIGRLLMSRKYSVGIIAQPDYNDPEAFSVFGEPRLGFLVTGGNIDSMVNHYTVAKKTRGRDMYSPGGKAGLRPDRATIVYCNKIREAYKNTPVIIGGLEASLRRLAHYDYWDNRVRRSILLDSAADLLVYGMGELQILEIAQALNDGFKASHITFVNGTVYKTGDLSGLENYRLLPDYKKISADKSAYAESFLAQYRNTDHVTGGTLAEPYGNIFVVQNPPMRPLTTSELDGVHALCYARTYHPVYEESGGVPAISEVRFSIISNRGCFGSCNFCALTFHQGRFVQARSHDSIINEAKNFVWEPDFKGYIHDVGGPTANFRRPACEKQKKSGACPDRQCLFPKPCKNLSADHSDYLALLRKLRDIPKIKKVFIRSGIRYDYLMSDRNDDFFNELCKHHISGQLKVAPEHISQAVLQQMGKPGRESYEAFEKKFYAVNKKLGMKQFLVPYLMSSHPGSDLDSAVELAEYLRDSGHMPEQVQDFYPTPGTLSTCVYYCEFDPRTNRPVHVPKNPHEKAMQRALMQYRLPQNYELVLEALKKANRQDLIGFSEKCLIRPRVITRRPQDSRPRGQENSNAAPYMKAKPKKKKTIRNVHKKPKG